VLNFGWLSPTTAMDNPLPLGSDFMERVEDHRDSNLVLKKHILSTLESIQAKYDIRPVLRLSLEDQFHGNKTFQDNIKRAVQCWWEQQKVLGVA